MENTITITLSAEEQELQLVDPASLLEVAQGTEAYIYAQFELGSNWETGHDLVRAMWRSKSTVIPTILDSNNMVQVPQEVLAKLGRVSVNLVGCTVEEDVITERLTTEAIEAINVRKSALVGSGGTEVTPSEFEQFVALVKADADRAENAQEAAENAQEAAENAQSAAENAQASAESAQTAAHNYAAAAETFKNNASGFAEDAGNYATAALNSATAAAGSATEAAAAKLAAERAKTASEAAQSAAETAKTAAETAQSEAESAAETAELAETSVLAAEIRIKEIVAGAILIDNDGIPYVYEEVTE